MSDLKCPVCKSDSYLNPGIKILISPCFHKLCEQCVYRIFARGYAPCPICQTPLRRVNFIASTFEDVEVAREVNIRRITSRHFTRKSTEFNSEEEYNDYLEAFENLVFELLEMKNETLIKEKIERIKNEKNILNPVILRKDNGANILNEEGRKKVCIEEEPWTIFKSEKIEKLDRIYEVPDELMVPHEAEGLSLAVINKILLMSLKLTY